jgi:hypothetical protein
MENTRHGLRAKCSDKCVLVINGSTHVCTLENISISGALIQVSEYHLGIQPGSRCGLHLCNDPNICPGEYACQITRITPKEIGLKFLNMG